MALQTNSRSAQVLAIGFAMTVSMWAVGYVAMMGPGLELGEILFALTLACLVAGGIFIGRYSSTFKQAIQTGVMAGALSAALNLLLIGSLIGGESTAERLSSFALWSGGTLIVSMALCAAGAGASFRVSSRRSEDVNWYHRFVIVAAVAVFLLLMTGGLVTSLEAGLAVPDWPNSFGHNMLLYPLEEMVGGVYYEHAHRLYGMLVGVTSMTLAATLFVYDRRKWLWTIGIVVLIMVCIQGVLGGLRVTGHLTFSADPGIMNPNTHLAVVHGVFGQVVFASIVAIAAWTSTTWTSTRPPAPTSSASTDHSMSLMLVVLLVVQLALGALYRHLRREAGESTAAIEWLYVHIFLAAVVIGAAVFVGGRAWAFHSDQPILPRLGRTLVLLIVAQLALGISSLIAVLAYGSSDETHTIEVAITSAHQATGAVILAIAMLLAIWSRRLVAVDRARS